MSEITTIWNQQERFQDLSEVWSPSEGDEMDLLRTGTPGRYPKHAVIEGRIGYMIMPGIYYFGDFDHGMRPPLIESGLMELVSGETAEKPRPEWTREAAVIGREIADPHGMLEGIWISYLAVDRENIEILRKIYQTLEDKRGYVVLLESSKEKEKGAVGLGVYAPRGEEKKVPEICPESTAEELMPGIGIHRIRVGLKYIFHPRKAVKEYEYAYKTGNKVVLIDGGDDWGEGEGRKEYDLRIMEELTVRRTEQLHCGLLIDRDYHLIDCAEQKARQMLTPEAYEILREHHIV